MKSYRFARRSFLSAVGGAFGLHTMLRTMEAAAAGEGAPPRFLLMNWPCGSVKYQYVPMGTGTGYTASSTRGQPGYIISPFATPELKPHTHILIGFDMQGLNCPGGGAHEAGTPFSTTGASGPGTRKNGGETDDGCAGGPSWDQILLAKTEALKTKGRGYYNVICDSRVDSYETSTRCLSYGYTKQQIAASNGGSGGMLSENTPLRPTLSPITAYNDLFQGFTPGGGGMTDQNALRLLKQRKSVLDHSLRELERLKTLAPANERNKIDAHAEVIRKLEMQLSDQINNPSTTNACEPPMAPAMNLNGLNSDRNGYGDATAATDDAPNHAAVGAAHSSIIRAAFACDIIRVATFEWSPGTNHVSFKGADPNSPNTIYMHHPLSHKKLVSSFYQGSPPGTDRYIWDAMAYVQHWYFNETAKFVLGFLNQKDPLDPAGGSLLDRTVITAVSEVGNPSHDRNDASALIIGGSKLGMQPGGFQSLSNSHHNRVWLTTAQAFLGADPLSKLKDEVFYKTGVTPIPGVWAAPK